jgi:hypothetical protein
MEAKQKPTGTAKIYPNPIGQNTPEEKQQITAPMAMAELEIMKLEGAKSVAYKSPEIRNIAILLIIVLGVTLVSQISSYLIIESSSNTQTSFLSLFINSNGVLGITLLLIQAITIFILLFTRNTSHAKTILLVAGIGFGVTLVKGLFSFQIGPSVIIDLATLGVNFFILRKIFKVYLEL